MPADGPTPRSDGNAVYVEKGRTDGRLDEWLRSAAQPGRLVSSEAELVRALEAGVSRIQTVNLHHLYLMVHDSRFAADVFAAEAWTADGWPVAAVMRLLGAKVQRVTGRGLVENLVRHSATYSGIRRVALVGASQSAGKALSDRLKRVGREVVLAEHGRMESWEPVALAQRLRAAQPDLVLVAVTPPRGERFAALLTRHAPGAPVVGVGGAVDMAAGIRSSAPTIVERTGLEWLWRLAQEPRRLGRRYLVECLRTLVLDLPPALARARVSSRRRSGDP